MRLQVSVDLVSLFRSLIDDLQTHATKENVGLSFKSDSSSIFNSNKKGY